MKAGHGAGVAGPSVATPSLVPPAPCLRAGKGVLARSVRGDMASPGATESRGPGVVLLPAPWSPVAPALGGVGLSAA